MTHALDHVTRLETSLSGLLEHAVETHAGAGRDADEIARLGAELLAQPGTADTIGDLFDAVVGGLTLMAERSAPPSSTRVGRALAPAWTEVAMRPSAMFAIAIQAATSRSTA